MSKTNRKATGPRKAGSGSDRTSGKGDWRAAANRLNAGIRRELSKFPQDKVDQFLRSVFGAISAHDIVKVYTEKNRRAELDKLRKAATAFLEEGVKPVMGDRFPQRVASMLQTSSASTAFDNYAEDFYWQEGRQPVALSSSLGSPHAQRFYRARVTARNAVADYLLEIKSILKLTEPRPRSRPPADEYGLLSRIAQQHFETFGVRPTQTPGGTFSNIIALVLEHVDGRMPRDVSRQIKAALENMTKVSG